MPVSKKGDPEEEKHCALERAITAGSKDELGFSSKQRVRKKPNETNSNTSMDSSRLSTPTGSGNLSNYDTDDNADMLMYDMLIKNATDGEKRTRIRKNRAKQDSKSTRKSCK